MASEIEIKLTWENNNFFKMEKNTGAGWMTVVEIKENAHIANIAGHLKNLCIADFTAHLDAIMKEMRS